MANYTNEQQVMQKAHKFHYMMLSRLQQDAQAFFGRTGNENEDKWDCRYHNEHAIWGKNIRILVCEMKKFYHMIPEDIKPEWLNLDEILSYEKLVDAYEQTLINS